MRYSGVRQLRRPVQLLLALLMLQLGLGFAAYLTRLQWMVDPSQPVIVIVISTVAHVAGGALVLATCVVLAIQTRRMINVHATEAAVHSAPRKAVTA